MALYCTEGQYSVKEGIKTNQLGDCVSSLFQIYQALFFNILVKRGKNYFIKQWKKDTALLCLTAHFLSSLVTIIQGSKFPESTTISLIDFMKSTPLLIFVLSLVPKTTWGSTVIKLYWAHLCHHLLVPWTGRVE